MPFKPTPERRAAMSEKMKAAWASGEFANRYAAPDWVPDELRAEWKKTKREFGEQIATDHVRVLIRRLEKERAAK